MLSEQKAADEIKTPRDRGLRVDVEMVDNEIQTRARRGKTISRSFHRQSVAWALIKTPVPQGSMKTPTSEDFEATQAGETGRSKNAGTPGQGKERRAM